jgi:hypothetical protein
MIDVEPRGRQLPADRAPAALPRQHRVVVRRRHPVLVRQQPLAPALAAAAGELALAEVRIARVALAHMGVDRGPVRGAECLVPGQDFPSILRVLRVALAATLDRACPVAVARGRVGGLQALPKLRIFRVPLLAAGIDLGGVGGAVAGRGGESPLAKFRVQRIAVVLAPAIRSHRCREPCRRKDARAPASRCRAIDSAAAAAVQAHFGIMAEP